MDKSIESIWKNGFASEQLTIPTVEKLYNRKSVSYTEKMIARFKKEIMALIPLAVFLFLINIFLENDNAIIWGLISSIPCLIWYFIGKAQLKSLRDIDYKSNSFDYLISIRFKLNSIQKFNKKLAISSIPILVLPLLLYTYYNQAGKTISEIFGIAGLNYPTITIFLILPILTLAAFVIAQIQFKRVANRTTVGIDELISEMDELRK